MYDAVRTVVKKMCPLMREIKVADLNVEQLGGGLTNVLYIVSGLQPIHDDDDDDGSASDGSYYSDASYDAPPPSQPAGPGRPIPATKVCALVRVHGDDSQDVLIDRSIEHRVSASLSAASIAPAYFGRFVNGRVEEFYSDAKTITPLRLKPDAEQLSRPDEILSVSATVPVAMAEIHKLAVGNGVAKTDRGTSQCWATGDLWLASALEKLAASAELTAKVEASYAEYGGVKRLVEEWRWLKETLDPSQNARPDEDASGVAAVGGPSLPFARDVVFTHMDCQSLNILTSKNWAEHEVRLIDFEYSGHNPRALDLGNTFCECCSQNDLCPDYEKEYPTEAEGRFILHKYMIAGFPDFVLKIKAEKGEEGYEDFLSHFRHEVDKHALISHMSWIFWAIIQAAVSPIDYDYVMYGKIRYMGLDFGKNKVLMDAHRWK